MRTHRPLALLVGSLLLVVLATGVAAAETGDGTALVSMLDRLVSFLEMVVDLLESTGSMG